jgi:hypothetical protein
MMLAQERERAAYYLERRDPEGGRRFPEDLNLYCWPETFASTSGPHGGYSGQMITTCTTWAFVDQFGHAAVMCEGKWKFIDRREFHLLMRIKW